MPETRAAEGKGGHQDKRVLVLLLVGLCIGLPHLFDLLAPSPDPHQPREAPAPLVWLETAAGGAGNGLYQLDEQTRDWPRLLAALGRSLPPAALPPLHDGLPSAYRLPAAGPPQSIPLPARLAPLFFQPIPINQANAEVLMTIPGIGPRLAAAIIAHRLSTGVIKDRATLMAVDGIGEKKAAVIAAHVRFE